MITLTVAYPQVHPSSLATTGQRTVKRAQSTTTGDKDDNMHHNPHHSTLHHIKQDLQKRPSEHHVSRIPTQSKQHTHSGDRSHSKHTIKVEQLFEDYDPGVHASASVTLATSNASETKSTCNPGVSLSNLSQQSRCLKVDSLGLESITPASAAGRKTAPGSVRGTKTSGASTTIADGEQPADSHTSLLSRRASLLSKSAGGTTPMRMSGTETLRLFGSKLTEYEKSEVTQFKTVYYLGQMAAKKAALSEGEKNNGFDDKNGFLVCKQRDHILYRYEIQDVLGTGTFGQVVKALDHKTKSLVALKIVKNERPFLRQAREEIRILEVLRKLDTSDNLNLVHIYGSFNFRGHVCITFELLGMSLHQLLKRTKKVGFSLGRIQRLTRGMLRCLDVLYKNRIIHCDLKPENILLRRNASGFNMSAGGVGGFSDCSIKIIDFGSSCYEQQQIYSYIQSRYYRAPEVILGTHYTCAIDMWSLACVVGELLIAQPLFAGEDESDQLACIMEVRGVPPRTLLDRCKSTEKYFNTQGQPRYLTSAGRKRGAPMTVHLSTALRNCEDTAFLDFMRRALTWDPATRLTPPEALTHPWILRGGGGLRPQKGEPLQDDVNSPPLEMSKCGVPRMSETKSDTAASKPSNSKTKRCGTATNNNSISNQPPRPRRPQTTGTQPNRRRAALTVSVDACITRR